jgi:hypothetical protein
LQHTVLVYSLFESPRLHFILHWVFREQLQLAYRITADTTEWNNWDGWKLNYSREDLPGAALRIIPQGLLQEEGIRQQPLAVNRWKHSTILFYNQPAAAVPFDLFSAAFYLLSRYEEYLPHKTDKHGRYTPEQSAAGQYAFLQQPVVDEWICQLKAILERQYKAALPVREFTYLPSYDIDIAWRYRYKSALRTAGGYLRDFVRLNWGDIAERRAVLTGRKKDPYDSFAWLDECHAKYKLQPLYFFLLGTLSRFDRNADPQLPAMQELMRSLTAKYETGIHPSYSSHEDISRLRQEINILYNVTGVPVTRSRQHYIKFSLPETYKRLEAAGITADYSMGYASCNGFRAGTSCSFAWYDLSMETTTALRIHPFAFMEATSKFYGGQSPDAAFAEWERLYHAVRKVNGCFTSIWHNHILGTHKDSRGWRALYERTLALIASGTV